ncbi:hypothetical protein QA649_29860 [Bradyrhizobium sp. CB1717]|uniref:hypothetical protein n=1 Tax=Bradyrhizobium sp. CB1717 TaxID=3039154 RepID=UPI0024B24EE7|nr:hypothetical protein [Bradyrhizobium sp. CB1717]WFU22270.1 hypothetical protein QA649_29860 [Bradyrhizobium sp. CB1717]
MSTDKLQALSDTIAGILNEPPSRATYFDPEPHDGATAGERAAKSFDNPAHGIGVPKGSFGQLSAREAGISRNPAPEAHIARSDEYERTSRASEQPPSKLEAASLRPDLQTLGTNTQRAAASSNRISLRGWGLFGLAGVVLAAGAGAAAVVWPGSSGDAAKATSQTSPATMVAPGSLPPELTPVLQSMSRDLASLKKEIEQLKLGRDQLVRDSASLGEQLKTSQDQLGRAVAKLSDQVKAGQELAGRDNANAAEQIKAVRDQLIRLEQNAAPKKLTPPPRTTAPVAPKPAPAASSPQAAAQPAAVKPKPAPTAPASAPASTPAR